MFLENIENAQIYFDINMSEFFFHYYFMIELNTYKGVYREFTLGVVLKQFKYFTNFIKIQIKRKRRIILKNLQNFLIRCAIGTFLFYKNTYLNYLVKLLRSQVKMFIKTT